jgi:4-amino-4-deoxy-L-arabinose transferase-like glycosyltransferase
MVNLLILIAFVFVALFLGFGIGSYPLISPDEPRYAETAREMLERMDFIVPFCDYAPRYDKPILFYWFELIFFKTLGVSELASRLPSVIAGTGTVWLAFLLANFHGFGIIAGLVALTTFNIFLFSKIAITDMLLNFLISAAISFFYIGYLRRANTKKKFAFKDKLSSRWLISSVVMMALGMLCKGPVAVVLPLMVILIFLILEKDLVAFALNTWVELLIGLVMFSLITLPWYFLVHVKTGGMFTQEFFIGHNFNRFTAVHTGHSAPFWFYVPVIVLGFFPWSFFLIQSLIGVDYSGKFNMRSDRTQNSKFNLFCLIWFLVVFIFFSISKTKLVTYIMPAYLPLIILVANWWTDKFKATKSNSFKNLDALCGFAVMCLISCLAMYLSITVFKPALIQINSSGFFIPIMLIGFLLAGSSLIAMTATLYKTKIAFGFLVGVSLIVYFIATKSILIPYAYYRDSGSKAYAQQLSPDDKLATYRLHSTVYSFYARRNISKLSNQDFYQYLTSPDTANKFFVTKTRYLKLFDNYAKTINKATEKNEFSQELQLYEITKENNYFSFGKALSVNKNFDNLSEKTN